MPTSVAIESGLYLAANPLALALFWGIYEVAFIRARVRQESRP